MMASDVSSSAGLLASSDTRSRTRIRDPRLLTAARALWIALVVLSLGIFAVGIAARYSELHTLSAQAGGQGPTRIQEHSAPLSEEETRVLLQLGLSVDFYAIYFVVLEALFALLAAVTGIVLFWRRSDDWMALLVSFTLVGLGVVYPNTLNRLPLAQPDLRWLSDLVIALSLGAGYMVWYLFPDGRFAPGWTRWLFLAFALWVLLIPLFPAISPIALPAAILYPIFLVIVATVLFAQIYRYRHVSGPLQRQQTKWVIIGAAISFTGQGILNTAGLAVPAFQQPGVPEMVYRLMGIPLFYAFAFLPILAIAFSTLRYRLWEVDLVINRSLVYGGLTLLLGVVFLGGLLLLQSALGALLGGQQTVTAAVIATAVIVALFNPARRRLQHFVDHRFYHLNVGLDQLQSAKPGVANPGALASTQIGPYQILEPLGRGGMGEVYKGFDPTLNRTVAIKILPEQLAQESQFRARFEREARTVAALKHPNIVSVFDFGEVDDKYYMVMEYIDGQELRDYLKQNGALPLDQVKPVMKEIASALDYAHEQGLVHRDVKPANIMLRRVTDAGGRDGSTYRAILMDFGIAKIVGGSTGLTGTGLMGTLDYMAPEQIRSAKEVDGRADIYALGVVLYQLLTGQLPFKGDNPGSVVFAHLQQPPPDPRDLNPDLPASAAKAVVKALAKKPEDRFQTAGELAAALV